MNFVAAILAALAKVGLNFWQSQAEKPKETTDANTPKDVADRNAGGFSKWKRMRDSKGGGDRPPV